MMWTIFLILIALGFGGALEKTSCLKSIINAIKSKVSSFAGTRTAAIGTAFTTNLVAGAPYLSIALPGRMYSPVYCGMSYSTLNLSRGIEEGGTLMSPLIPWNSGGAFVMSAYEANKAFSYLQKDQESASLPIITWSYKT
jgi:NhaC family Na+:H+ antiporter